MTRVPTVLLAAAGVLLAVAAPAMALRLTLDPPGDREFVRDLAGIVNDADKTRLQDVSGRLLTERSTPIIVVTINSMAEHGGADLRIETFGQLLFDQWGIGHAEVNGQTWNTGILLLVSQADRKARIQLGAGWRRDKDGLCSRIMDRDIIPKFKQGNYSGGILAGVEALDKMARADAAATPHSHAITPATPAETPPAPAAPALPAEAPPTYTPLLPQTPYHSAGGSADRFAEPDMPRGMLSTLGGRGAVGATSCCGMSGVGGIGGLIALVAVVAVIGRLLRGVTGGGGGGGWFSGSGYGMNAGQNSSLFHNQGGGLFGGRSSGGIHTGGGFSSGSSSSSSHSSGSSSSFGGGHSGGGGASGSW